MLKRVTALICAIFFLPFGWIQARSATHTESLSPAIEIFRHSQVMIKSNLAASAISFCQEDFDEILGEEYLYLTVMSLPESVNGVLKLNGESVKEGQILTRYDLDQMTFTPSSPENSESTWTYQDPRTGAIYVCRLLLCDEAVRSIENRPLEFETFQNVKFAANIEIDAGQTVKVCRACSHGVLTLSTGTGAFRYAPETNFSGLDRFYYRVTDSYGNESAIRSATIHVRKAEKNLYFHDMRDCALHREAIALCCAGILNYQLDERGLPVFCPEREMTEEEYLSSLKKIWDAANTRDSARLASTDILPFQPMRKIDALGMLYRTYERLSAEASF